MENKEPHDIAEARIEIMNISKLGQNSRRALVDVAVNVDHSSSGARGWRGTSTDDKIRVAYAKPKRAAKNQNEPVNDRPDETAIEQRERQRREREEVRTSNISFYGNIFSILIVFVGQKERRRRIGKGVKGLIDGAQ